MKYIIIALLISLSFGCSRAQKEESAPEITAQDIAHALHMGKWTIQIPKDCPPDSRLGLKAVFKNDSTFLRVLPTEPGKNITLIIWRDQDSEQFNYHAICNDSALFGTLGLQMKTGSFYGWMNSLKICAIGDQILQGHTGEEGFHIELCLTEK
jgi:hypothetical protein